MDRSGSFFLFLLLIYQSGFSLARPDSYSFPHPDPQPQPEPQPDPLGPGPAPAPAPEAGPEPLPIEPRPFPIKDRVYLLEKKYVQSIFKAAFY